MSKQIIVPVSMPGGAESVKTIQSMQQEMAALNEQLETLDVNSDAFTEVSTKIGLVKSQLRGIDEGIERIDPKKKADQFVKMGEGIAGGFAIAMGALSAFGVENEKLAAIEAKTQGAIAIATGIRAIREGELIEIFQKSKVAKLAMAAAEKVYAFATGGATAATKAFRIALIATGIGAIVVLIAALVANFDKISQVLGLETNPATVEFAKVTAAAAEASKKAIEQFSLEAREMAALGRSIKDITQAKKKALTEGVLDTQAAIDAQKKFLIEAGKVGMTDEEFTEAQGKLETLLNDNKEFSVQLLEIKKAEEDEKLKMVEQAEEDYAAKKKEASDKAKADRDKAKQEKKAELEEEKKVREEFLELAATQGLSEQEIAVRDLKKRVEEFRKAGVEEIQLQEFETAELSKINTEFNKSREESAKASAQKLVELQREVAIGAIEDVRQRALTELEIQKQRELESLESFENYEALKVEIETKYAQQRIQVEKEMDKVASDAKKDQATQEVADRKRVESAKLDAASSAINGILAINESFGGKTRKAQKRQFQINKGLQIADTAINTYKSATAAFSSMAGIPVVGPVLGAIAAAGAVAAGLASINNIRKQQFDEGGGGGGSVSAPSGSGASIGSGGGGAGGGAGLAGIDLSFLGKGDQTNIGNQTENNLPPTNSRPVRAYVVSSEITNKQAEDQRIKDLSTL